MAFLSIVVVVTLSLLFSHGVISSVQATSLATHRIANGHYDERVQVLGEEELAQLATRFNQMAEKLNHVGSMQQRLIGDVSHELHTLLTAIKGSMVALGVVIWRGTGEHIHFYIDSTK